MKLHEKIRYIRKNSFKLTLKEFHKRLQDIFGERALTYPSLCRLEKGYRDSIRLGSLHQICTGFGIPLTELIAGTDREGSKIVNIVRRKSRSDNEYVYNAKAIAEIVSPRNMRILAMELVVRPQGVTREEQDPVSDIKFEKLLIMLQGELTVYIGDEKHVIKKGDSLSFYSNIPHHFENASNNLKARCVVVQNPKSY